MNNENIVFEIKSLLVILRDEDKAELTEQEIIEESKEGKDDL